MSAFDDQALAVFRSSALGRLWRAVVNLSYVAWFHSHARRLAGSDVAAAATVEPRARIEFTAWIAATAAATALLLLRLSQPPQPMAWLVPAAVLTIAALVITGCRAGRPD